MLALFFPIDDTWAIRAPIQTYLKQSDANCWRAVMKITVLDRATEDPLQEELRHLKQGKITHATASRDIESREDLLAQRKQLTHLNPD